jgi:hypothetical protein
MATNCAGIFQSQFIDCQDPLAVGTVQRLFLANYDDVEDITFSIVEGEENVIETIVMAAGTSFFEFEGVNQSLAVQQELVRQATANNYRQTIDFSIFEVDNITLQNMQAMAYKRQVAITYGANDSSLGNGAFQYSGKNSGLDLLTNIRINGSVETGGAHVMQLATPEAGASENELSNVIWDTDYPTTLAYIETLLTPAV